MIKQKEINPNGRETGDWDATYQKSENLETNTITKIEKNTLEK